ncbi:dihydrodipicolinate synthase family protein [Pseudochelatococcus sp. B33]
MYEKFAGIYASTIVPMDDRERIDREALARHMADVASTTGIRGLLINGHAGENATLTAAEKQIVVEIAREAVGDGVILISGVNAEASAQAAADAAAAEAAGADSLLVFPPFSWALPQGPDVALIHHKAVLAATELPIMLYQASIGAGSLAYSPDTLKQLLALGRIAAIKDGSWETSRYEANYRLVSRCAPEVLMMPSGDEHLLTTFILGGKGSQVSIAAIIPETVVALRDAVATGDLAAARNAHERIYPLAKAVYGTAPASRATARIKACLHILGRIPTSRTRAPISCAGEEETAMLEKALEESGISA